MIITLVIDMFGSQNNGTTVTCMRTAKLLKEHGNEVRIVAYIPEDSPDDLLSEYKVFRCGTIHVPVFQPLIDANGYTIAKVEDYHALADFLKGSDLVHLMTPLPLAWNVRRVAKVMGIATSSAMHLQPENISFNIHMGHINAVNSFIYWFFKHTTIRYTEHVHTPSEMMRDQMRLHNYHNRIHAISNGVASRFVPTPSEKPEELKDKYVILMVGRLSGEKRQDLIIKAIGHSKYNDRIQLILCGQGPRRKQYEKLSRKYLKNPCIFAFLSQDDLLKTINYADLYIHASDAESEAISCIEAFSCGKVPVISDSAVSATNHFALDERCLFKAGDWKSLRDRIEYWMEHGEEKEELSKKYVEYGKTFNLENCVYKLEDMFRQAIEDDRRDKENHIEYYHSKKENKKLRKAAKRAGIEDPCIVE